MTVHFYLPDEPELDHLRTLVPDEAEAAFRTGERAWILQTWIRLRDAGLPVELTGEVPAGPEVLVFHTKHRALVATCWRRLRGTVLVSVRADGREAAIADLEVVQNGCFADGRRRLFVPHWPQPGLIPRDRSRGPIVRAVAYKGLSRHLDASFRTAEWASWLADRGLEWRTADQEWIGPAIERTHLDWHDFRDVDVVLAVRPPSRRLHTSKPASKLVNAWIAGCPAVLGAEYAFRELRRSPLDYLEATDAGAARECLERLCSSPALFEDMVANGLNRAREYSIGAITDRWVRFLSDHVAMAANRGSWHRRSLILRPAIWAARATGRILARRPAR